MRCGSIGSCVGCGGCTRLLQRANLSVTELVALSWLLAFPTFLLPLSKFNGRDSLLMSEEARHFEFRGLASCFFIFQRAHFSTCRHHYGQFII